VYRDCGPVRGKLDNFVLKVFISCEMEFEIVELNDEFVKCLRILEDVGNSDM